MDTGSGKGRSLWLYECFGLYGDSYFVSYRDPNLGQTNDVFENTVNFVEQFDVSERDMTKYVIGAISDMDIPLTPAQAGVRSMTAWLTETTLEDLQKIRDEVLSASPADIRALSEGVRNFWRKAVYALSEMRAESKRRRSCLMRSSAFSIHRKETII